MSYENVFWNASRLVEQAGRLSLSPLVSNEIEFLRKLISGDYKLAGEIARLQVFIRGEGEVPDFDGDVRGLEEEIQADGIVATVMSISNRFGEEDRPEIITNVRQQLAQSFASSGKWGARIVALADQEQEIVHRLQHGMSMAWA